MTEQIAESKKVGDAIKKWVAQHNRRDEGSRQSREEHMHFMREEGGLKVTDHTTFYYDGRGDLDAMGTHTVATFNSSTVYEQAGGQVKAFVAGDWTKILES